MAGSKRQGEDVAELFNRGVGFHREGRNDEAARAYDDVLRRVPTHGAALNMRGAIELQRGDASAALRYFDAALASDPDRPGVHLNRGNALRALERRREALASYDRALALDPRMTIAHVNRGNVLRDDGALPEAEAAYRAALSLDPSSFPAAFNLAFVLGQRGEGDEAVLAALEVAMEIATRLGLRGREVGAAFAAAGVILQRAARHDDAIAALESACARDPASASAQMNLGRALTAVARYADAVAPMRRAIELEPQLPQHLDTLAVLLRRIGRNAEAAEVYARWMEIEPDNPIPTHMHLALTGAPAPATANLDYVRREFDGFADRFDEVLRTQLEYRAPELVLQAIHETFGAEPGELDIADLGCGTGLCGPLVRPFARRLVGVDLSPEMLARAAGRGYDELVESDIAAFCASHPHEFDLLVAADVFVYIGALGPVLAEAHRCLRERGTFVFTIERSADDDKEFHLTPGGRYSHSESYVRTCLDAAGFEIVSATHAPLRTELRVPVMGAVFVARAR